jgi:signal transduction histidine kinase
MTAPAEILHGFLVAWLSYHILGEDQAMARHLARLRGETPPPMDVERTTGALLEAMRNLYRVLSRMNADLAESNRRLEEKVALRTSELTTANARLQQEQAALKAMLQKVQETQNQLLQSEKMASIGQLAAGVAHEINNPIGFVNSNLGSLGRYIDSLMRLAVLGAATPEGQTIKDEINLDFLRTDVVDLLKESQEGLDRVRKIVANLKDFSHVDQAEWQQADIVAGLESTLNVASHELKYKADIARELTPLPSVRCIPAQINQVFLNLLVNSAQAIRDHGTITLRSGVDGEFVWVEVQDSGCGMDETTKRRMFEPFFTTKPVGTGTGLGMSLTYDIIKKHGGEFVVDSTPGVGTRIRIRLPIGGPAGA